ncbi:MAG TPA: DUF4402 domain-containing protein [Sphingomicrobium sp.]|nr:DUF4402 domain-containing protein [Sphingomicrobium sp.]
MGIRIKLALAAALVAVATPAAANPPASAPANAKALLLIPLSITKVDDLNFGSVVSSSTSGTVSVAADGSGQSVTGGVTAIPSGTVSRATFAGAGTAGQTVNIFLAPPANLSDGAGHTVPISLSLESALVTIDSTRAFSVGIGGTVTVAANQAAGTYTGTFTVLAQYN